MYKTYPVTNVELKRVTQFIARSKQLRVGKMLIQDGVIYFRENKDWYKVMPMRTPKPIEDLVIKRAYHVLTNDVCANCGGFSLNYHDDNPTIKGRSLYYAYTCSHCGKEGKIWYELTFFYNQPKGKLR